MDGSHITRIGVSSFGSLVGAVLQDVFLFAGTIRSNILMRMEGVSDEEVMRVCRYVNADKVIAKLTGGLDE